MAKSGARPASRSPGGSRSSGTREALVAAAISALGEVGFAGASAREIARRAGCNQALVFYHFGSVTGLLLAALDDVSARRLTAYRELLAGPRSLPELVDGARTIFIQDLDAGHVSVLVEMITGAQWTPGLREQVAARVAPWREFAVTAMREALAGSPVELLVPAEEVAHAVVAGFLGLQLLTQLDEDRTAALDLFGRALLVGGLLDAGGGFRAGEDQTDQGTGAQE